MMVEFNIPDDVDMEKAKDVFYQVASVSELTRELRSPAAPAQMSSSRLYAYAQSLDKSDPALEERLKTSLSLRRILKEMIRGSSTYHLPELMAASTGELQDRVGQDCHIRFEASRAEPGQVYVIVEMVSDKQTRPSLLIICDEEFNFHQYDLPEMRNRISQMISQRNSELLRLLSNPKSEVFLR